MQKPSDEALQDMVCRYTELACRYSSIPHGIGWKPEYEAEEELIWQQLQQIRLELGI